jgi:hypothetical protein
MKKRHTRRDKLSDLMQWAATMARVIGRVYGVPVESIVASLAIAAPMGVYVLNRAHRKPRTAMTRLLDHRRTNVSLNHQDQVCPVPFGGIGSQ